MKGSLLFVRGSSHISKLIQRLDGQYSHIAISLTHDDSVILEAQRFTKSRICMNYFDDYDVITLPFSNEQLNKLLEKSIELVDYEYDYIQIFTTAINRLFNYKIFNTENKYICSELVLKLLFEMDYITMDEYMKMRDCTPNELYDFVSEKMK